MRLESLTLRNFRNYGEVMLGFSPRTNIVLGKNGQGKTNLLEALYYLSHARSQRTGTDRELIRSGEDFATLSAQVIPQHYEGNTRLEIQFQGGNRSGGVNERMKTVFKVNGSPVRSRSQFLGYLPTVSFFLSDLQLLRGAPEDRRRWLDAAITQYDKRHLEIVTEYQKIRQHKNQLLKQPPELISREHLGVWDEQLVRTGARLMEARMVYLSHLKELACLQYLELSGGQEQLGFSYQSAVLSSGGTEIPSIVELEQAVGTALQQARPDELRRGTCLVGPHRDDIRFTLTGKTGPLDAVAYGSQGQQRSVVLSLKLTELAVLSRKINDHPVLLLDDVMAELDPARQRLLLESISPESQVFLSTTHLDGELQPLLSRDDAPTLYRVEQGQIYAMNQPVM